MIQKRRWRNVTSVIRHRDDLRLLIGNQVRVSGRVKEFRKHEKRRDLDTICLVNLVVTPLPMGESLFLSHIWVLRRQFQKMGRIPTQNERVKFTGKIYEYVRLGGRSAERKLLGHQDFGICPLKYEN